MLQAVVKKGKVIPVEVTPPMLSSNEVIIQVRYSAISAGTEMINVKTSGKNIFQRIQEQPENLKKVMDFLHSKGIKQTISTVQQKLGNVVQTGYSVSGVVIAVGSHVRKFKLGDHVAAAGAGFANHAEFVSVPENLVVPIPDGLDYAKASTVTLGAIAMQSVRRVDLSMGSFCVVTGTGILGLLAIQMLRNSGIRVIAIDLNAQRLQIALKLGAEFIVDAGKVNPVEEVKKITSDMGADAVLLATATSSNEVLSQAFNMCRRKGTVVLLGTSGMQINREDMYSKELDFKISTSYGPGRYDDNYERNGVDYPYAYVRWTENRNMQEYLRLVASGAIDLKDLIASEYDIMDVEKAFASFSSPSRPLIVLLKYSDEPVEYDQIKKTVSVSSPASDSSSSNKVFRVGLIGVGDFVLGMHLPNLAALGGMYQIHTLCNRSGIKSLNAASFYKAKKITSDPNEVFNDPDIDLVMICTRHDSHAAYVCQALNAGKNVFVEKPLATNAEDLDRIKEFYKNGTSGKPVLMTGYNRRFSPYAQKIQAILPADEPKIIHYRMNAGFIPPEHWVHKNGGRIVGEACHIIDFLKFITGADISEASVFSLGDAKGKYSESDNKSMIFHFADGSVASFDYFSSGNKGFSKEYMEIHCAGKTIALDDFSEMHGYGINADLKTAKQEKGHLEELKALYLTLSGKQVEWPISLDSMLSTTELTFEMI